MNTFYISKDKIWLLRNEWAKFEIAPSVYKTIIEWCYNQPLHQSLEDYLLNNDIVRKSGIYRDGGKEWLKKNKDKLQATDLEGFYVTFLHELLHIICHAQIERPGTTLWNTRSVDPTSVEYCLKFTKEFRNHLSHAKEKAVLDDWLQKLQYHIVQGLEIAAVLYGVTDTEKQRKISEVKQAFDQLIEDTTSTPERRIVFIEKCFTNLGRSVLENLIQSTVTLAGKCLINVSIDEVFYIIRMSRKKIEHELTLDESGKQSSTVVFPCSEILDHLTGTTTIVSAGAGSGKTTLMRKIFMDILQVNKQPLAETRCFKGAGNFTLPQYIECRSERSCTLLQYVRNLYLKFLFEFTDEEILRTFEMLKGLIFLVDGYDEADQPRRDLIKEVVLFCDRSKGHARCLISSRVEAANWLVNQLSKSSIGCRSLTFEKITDPADKQKFLQNYCKYFKTNYPNTFRIFYLFIYFIFIY